MPFTADEHKARAMLLGLEHVPDINAYGKYVTGMGRSIRTHFIDADTLEPLSDKDREKRWRKYLRGE